MFVLDDEVTIDTIAILEDAAPSVKDAAKLARKLAGVVAEYGGQLARLNEVYRSPSLGRSAKQHLKCGEKLDELHEQLKQASDDVKVTVDLLRSDFARIEQWVRAGYAAQWQGTWRPPAQDPAVKRTVKALVERLDYQDLIAELQDVDDPIDSLGGFEDSSFLKLAHKLSGDISSLTNDLETAVFSEYGDLNDVPEMVVTEWATATRMFQNWGIEDFEATDDDDDLEEDDDAPES